MSLLTSTIILEDLSAEVINPRVLMYFLGVRSPKYIKPSDGTITIHT